MPWVSSLLTPSFRLKVNRKSISDDIVYHIISRLFFCKKPSHCLKWFAYILIIVSELGLPVRPAQVPPVRHVHVVAGHILVGRPGHVLDGRPSSLVVGRGGGHAAWGSPRHVNQPHSSEVLFYLRNISITSLWPSIGTSKILCCMSRIYGGPGGLIIYLNYCRTYLYLQVASLLPTTNINLIILHSIFSISKSYLLFLLVLSQFIKSWF